MDVSENIFGEDVRDCSHFQIVSSDEEDLEIIKSPDNIQGKTNLETDEIINRSNYYDQRFERHFKLDKSVESQLCSDTQKLIDEINKIFEKSENREEDISKYEEDNFLKRGKKIINNIKSRLISIPEELFTPKLDSNELHIPNRRKRSSTKNNYNYDSYFGDLFSNSSSESVFSDDEDYDPGQPSKKKPKRKKKKILKNKSKLNKKLNEKKKKSLERKNEDFDQNKKFDIFGFDKYSTFEDHTGKDEQEFQNSSRESFSLKFVVIDQNKNLITDPRLDTVLVRTSETLGNIAKKMGRMYNLNQEEIEKIKIIIDGEPQDHNLQIGNPDLCVENEMQIDIKFPSKQNQFKKNSINTEEKSVKKGFKEINDNVCSHTNTLIPSITEVVEID